MTPSPPRRKLRVLVITLGGEREESIRRMFQDESLSNDFEAPTFVPGIPSRSLRNRRDFLRICHSVGLLPEAEWEALKGSVMEEQVEEERTPLNSSIA